ncbi:MAG: HD domain-containing protein [Xanthobacteraceae bacterium]|nr:HD domain-containing protein [Xanthobacteraceae bacterium]
MSTPARKSPAIIPQTSAPRIVVLADHHSRGARIKTMLEPHVSADLLVLDEVRGAIDADMVIVAASLRDLDTIVALRQVLGRAPRAATRIFTIDGNERALVVQAYSLGATDVVFTPFSGKVLRARLPLEGKTPKPRAAVVGECGRALEAIFSDIAQGRTVDLKRTQEATHQIIGSVAAIGLSGWIDDVRRHHEGTFQHCLLVAGVAVDFGMSINIAGTDLINIGLAATLHDIGKAAIEVEILDKPGELTADERAIVERHPTLGYESVKYLDGLPVDVRDAVRDHHELLDGSGYPDRLKGGAIGDLTRIITIADIFSTLIGERPSAPAMTRVDAFGTLSDMTGQLEQPLVAAFGATALRR